MMDNMSDVHPSFEFDEIADGLIKYVEIQKAKEQCLLALEQEKDSITQEILVQAEEYFLDLENAARVLETQYSLALETITTLIKNNIHQNNPIVK